MESSILAAFPWTRLIRCEKMSQPWKFLQGFFDPMVSTENGTNMLLCHKEAYNRPSFLRYTLDDFYLRVMKSLPRKVALEIVKCGRLRIQKPELDRFSPKPQRNLKARPVKKCFWKFTMFEFNVHISLLPKISHGRYMNYELNYLMTILHMYLRKTQLYRFKALSSQLKQRN